MQQQFTTPSQATVEPAGLQPSEDDYRKIASFRLALSEILDQSERILAAHGIGVRRFEAMLVIKTASGPRGVLMGDIARALKIKPGSTTGLIGRLEDENLVERVEDRQNRRQTWVRLTPAGEAKLAAVVVADRRELAPIIRSFTDFFSANLP